MTPRACPALRDDTVKAVYDYGAEACAVIEQSNQDKQQISEWADKQ